MPGLAQMSARNSAQDSRPTVPRQLGGCIRPHDQFRLIDTLRPATKAQRAPVAVIGYRCVLERRDPPISTSDLVFFNFYLNARGQKIYHSRNPTAGYSHVIEFETRGRKVPVNHIAARALTQRG